MAKTRRPEARRSRTQRAAAPRHPTATKKKATRSVLAVKARGENMALAAAVVEEQADLETARHAVHERDISGT